MPRSRSSAKNNATANLAFQSRGRGIWLAADKLRSNMDPEEYKRTVLGLIFLKYISDSFEEKRPQLAQEPGADPEDQDEYEAENLLGSACRARELPPEQRPAGDHPQDRR